ncbi:XkdX family protein [Enterococcus dongliensis]|uniref:XkdX family protein n=1 Tax=Enterococcus dongliensis TaxID=2559925 RepID=UPI00288DD167|nr:XkdX family protein [Enterococcus dongliensis]MDT2640456.1 XkdX family protein [Enterococcus dongliensis]
MFPSKYDIQFFYDLGLYNVSDIDFFYEAGYLTEAERREIVGEEENSEVEA